MKVLVANWLSSRGGEEKHVIDLATYLSVKPGVELFLAVPASSPWSAEIGSLPGKTVLDTRYSSKADLASILRLIRYLRRYRFDVVHVHGARAGWLVRLAAILVGYRRVIWSMHLLIRDHVSRQPSWTKGVYFAIERFLNRRTARIIAVSEDLRRGVLGTDPALDAATVITVANGISDPQPCEPALLPFPRTGSGLVCAAVGKLQHEKGHDVLIEAVALIPDAERPIAMIVGEGMLRGSLESRIRESGLESHVHLLGFQNNVIGLLTTADIYVMPSRYEGLPIALLEAMALGKPIVATAVNGIPEAIRDGENGLLVPSEDPAALAEALRRLGRDPALRRKLGDGARKSYLERYMPEHCFGAIYGIYAKLAA